MIPSITQSAGSLVATIVLLNPFVGQSPAIVSDVPFGHIESTINAPKPTPIPTSMPVSIPAVAGAKAKVATPKAPEDKELVKAYILEAAQKYNVDGQIMLKIAICESGLRSNAENGSFGGIFQFLSSTWMSNRRAMGESINPDLRYNAREAAMTAAFKMSRDGFGAWPACSRLALAQK